MTVTLELDAEEAAVLREQAARQGVDVEAILHRLVALLPRLQEALPALTQKQHAAVTLLASWSAEKRTMTPEELAESDEDFEETRNNIDRWRAEQGHALP